MAKAQITLGIEAGDSSLKLALLDTKARKLLRVDVLPLQAPALSEVARLENTLSSWLSEHGSPKLSGVCMALPAIHGVLRDLRLPPDADDVDAYIRWELSSALDTSLDLYYLDYELLPDRKKPTNALVCAYRRAPLDALREGLHRKDLSPSVVEPDLFSLFNLLEVGEGMDAEMRCVVKADRAGIMVAWGNVHGPATVRWVSTGLLGVDPDSSVYPMLAENLSQVLADGFALHHGMESVVRLCGELSVEGGFLEALHAKASGLEFLPWDTFLKISLDAEGCPSHTVEQCAAAIGCALRSAGDRK